MSRRHRRKSRTRRTICTPAWRPAWSVDDALRIHVRYVRWRATEAGAREMQLAMDGAVGGRPLHLHHRQARLCR